MTGLALDVDGVLTLGGRLIDGAAETLAWLDELEIPFVIISNRTSMPCHAVADELASLGLPVTPDDVVTAATLTAAYVRRFHPGKRCFLLGEGTPFTPDDGLLLVDVDVDVVIVGGAGPSFSYAAVDAAGRHLRGGAELIAMHRSLEWRTGDGLAVDSGAFLPGLELVRGARATVIGKPSPTCFRQALALKGIEAGGAWMVGDDLRNDVLAAQAVGMTGVLVRSGKFHGEPPMGAAGAPHHIIDSIADLPALAARFEPLFLQRSRPRSSTPA